MAKTPLSPVEREIQTLERRISRNKEKLAEIMRDAEAACKDLNAKAGEACEDLNVKITKDRAVLAVLKRAV